MKRLTLLILGMMLTGLPSLEAMGQVLQDTYFSLSSQRLVDEMKRVRDEGGAPGAVAIGLDRGRVEITIQGRRHVDRRGKVYLFDRFHVGSNGKAMTATVVGGLVERGMLRWEDTVGELFPDVAMHPDYRGVTVEQLLQHRGGLVALEAVVEVLAVPVSGDDAVVQRDDFAHWVLAQQPVHPVGLYSYSNGGYALVGAIIDRVSGMSYERAMRQYLFDPLRMSPLFTWPARYDPNQPWGHIEVDGQLVATDPVEPALSLPAWLRAAGDLSMNLIDFTKFTLLHMDAACGAPRLLSSETFERMHRIPAAGDFPYSMGWMEFIDAEGTQLSLHTGSAGNFYSAIAYAHNCETGLVILTNAGTDTAAAAVDNAVLRWFGFAE